MNIDDLIDRDSGLFDELEKDHLRQINWERDRFGLARLTDLPAAQEEQEDTDGHD